MMKVIEWVAGLIGGLFTGREPMVWLGIALNFFRQHEAILDQAAQAVDVEEMVAIFIGAFVFRSQYTPFKNRGPAPAVSSVGVS